jgi:hypothetical protein
MAIDPVSSQTLVNQTSSNQTAEAQRTSSADMEKNKSQTAPAKTGDAFTVTISQEAVQQAQANAIINPATGQTQQKPLM